jgi:hypothetical protein
LAACNLQANSVNAPSSPICEFNRNGGDIGLTEILTNVGGLDVYQAQIMAFAII